MRKENAQAPAMRGQLLNVDKDEAVALGQRGDGCRGEIAEVLVINGVELVVLEQRLEAREFKCDDPVALYQPGGAADEIVEVGHMGENVVAKDDIRLAFFSDNLVGCGLAEEIDADRNTLLGRLF